MCVDIFRAICRSLFMVVDEKTTTVRCATADRHKTSSTFIETTYLSLHFCPSSIHSIVDISFENSQSVTGSIKTTTNHCKFTWKSLIYCLHGCPDWLRWLALLSIAVQTIWMTFGQVTLSLIEHLPVFFCLFRFYSSFLRLPHDFDSKRPFVHSNCNIRKMKGPQGFYAKRNTISALAIDQHWICSKNATQENCNDIEKSYKL